MIDFGRTVLVSQPDLVDELIELTTQDAEALGCVKEVQRLRVLATETGADRQREVFQRTRAAGGSHDAAMRSVVQHLVEEFHADL